MEAVAGVDVDGNITDGHAVATHVVEEGHRCHQWSAPLKGPKWLEGAK